MARRPVVLIHGYSDRGASFAKWSQALEQRGYLSTEIHLGNYISLSNEISIKDIAEGFDRALRDSPLKEGQPFDAIVHSTGMLVIREWLAGTIGTADRPELAQERQARLKHLIGLAPATFGSPMAHKGRSWLGAMFKGGKEPGPDFMEAGDQVLKGLELGSAYTWELAHRDFLSDPPVYGRSTNSPYPFIFVGLRDYGWLKRVATEPGTDGTVRWAGTGFNSRKLRVDLTAEPTRRQRIRFEPWKNVAVPLVLLPDHNHSDILREPGAALIEMVAQALEVSSGGQYEAWTTKYMAGNAAALQKRKARRWQQLIVRAADERGDPITDYFVEVGTVADRRFRRLEAFDLDVHAFKDDESYRCFHVDLDSLQPEKLETLALRVIASSGTDLVAYCGYSSSASFDTPGRETDKWDAVIEFDSTIGRRDVQFFYPLTTTLVELRMDREPMPRTGVNGVFWFGEKER